MVAGIIGAAGYAGAELVRILSGHKETGRLLLSSTSYEGKKISDVYPNFLNKIEEKLVDAKTVIDKSDVVFAALPHGVGEEFAKECFNKGTPFIDLSADFRFDDDENSYNAWYDKTYKYPELHTKSVYGLPELNRQKIKTAVTDGKGAVIIGNPGCYPTASALGAMPALMSGITGDGKIIIDAASGITGGGREPQRSYHFPECSDAMGPYKVGAHRHTPEISRNFSFMENRISSPREIIFTPHLAPMNRGILSTIYIPLSCDHKVSHNAAHPRPPTEKIKEKTTELHKLYVDFYKNEQFVRVMPEGVFAATGRVRGSNYCDISVHIDQNGSTLIIISAIDNMVKGAAGQAVQNMNIVFGVEEYCGLETVPALF
ncbi:N-acetyl-gamma-glutamyl-phosphate reductase [Spirochaetia bacterium]|nr:N-acetyl-gamma-glutamyl-phosphate reductase [Spirochaetia bacterium]